MIGIELVIVSELERRVANGRNGCLRGALREPELKVWDLQHRASPWVGGKTTTTSSFEAPRRRCANEIARDVSGCERSTNRDQSFGMSKSHRGYYAPVAAPRVTS